MKESKPRGRAPMVAEADIRRVARALLAEQGPDAVTLRAIARTLGITAPALYRHYDSRDALLEALRLECCAELAAELSAEIDALPDNGLVQFFAICKGFRRWALANTKEFTLVFASPGAAAGMSSRFTEPFGRIFLAAAGRLLSGYRIITPATEVIPPALREDLAHFRTELLAALSESGQKFPAEKLDLGVTYLMIQIWARLYGHVTLEVFGNYPIPLSDPEVMFDAVLADLARSAGMLEG
ncbi:TetR/AcrR family transcriptional regulator [Nocardia farcinica]|uniref:TetR/AcrR family transcriptional regulator n=1 Tax=Nocardia farcinica TaxID=37329 RepID=UPI002454ED77|nr:TetR/AcrR family transcriptional regulator [Nocardia farcinica]